MIKLLMFILAVIFAVIGWMLSQSGFKSIQSIRQIERIPTTTIAAALSGEAKISATVREAKQFIHSEHFKKECVYFFYRYEEEETDSDGDKHWSTKYENSQGTNFIIEDQTGHILVNLESLSNPTLKINLPLSQQRVVGKKRYSEWRIEVADKLFLMGMLEPENNQIGFIKPGQYLPIISKYSEAHEKSSLGLKLLFKVCGGISLIAFAAFFLSNAFNIHHILAFLFILSFSVIIPLLQMGTSMLYVDIVQGEQRLKIQSEKTLIELQQELRDYLTGTGDWLQINHKLEEIKLLIATDKYQRIENLQLNLAFSQQQYIQQLGSFPNDLIAWMYNIKPQQINIYFNLQLRRKLAIRLSNYTKAETSGFVVLVIIIIGLVLCLMLSWLAFRLIRLKRHIENIPTSKTTGLVFGLSELKGRVKRISGVKALISPLTSSKCYWYYYKVEEKRRSGKKSHWVTIEKEQKYLAFTCRDNYGEIKVQPQHSEIITRHRTTTVRGKYRYTEHMLKLGDKIYLLGPAKIDRDAGDRLEIRANKGEEPYLITNYSEQKVMMRKAHRGMLSLTTAFSSLIFASLFFLGSYGNFSPADYLLSALIAPFYMSFIIMVLHYNDLIFLKRRVSRNRSNIEVCMQKRYDLIPALEKVLKKYLLHEKQLLTKLTQLRTKQKSNNASLQRFEKHLQQGQKFLTMLFVKVEDNPALKAVNLNLKLINQLVDLENEMGLLREGYNDAVTYYNIRLETIPDVLLAKMFKFQAESLFNYKARKFSRVEISM